MTNQIATFGAGCFWGIEAEFRKLHGVKEAISGYAGGHKLNPTYQDICRGDSGHTEVVQVTYDPEEIDFRDLLQAFWKMHDPTQINRQGPDHGFQYRSVIYCHDGEQEVIANASKDKEKQNPRLGGKPIATAIENFINFYPAEEYHQRYFEKKKLSHCPI